MRRFVPISGLFLGLVLVSPAGADAVSVVLELEGRLREQPGGMILIVHSEAWNLELDQFWLDRARDSLRKDPEARVFVTGKVAVRTFGNTLQLANRTVRVDSLYRGVPRLKITRTEPGSPAATRLKVNDILFEVAGEEIPTLDRLKELLRPYRGKYVPVVVLRRGRSEPIKIYVRERDGALGIWTETVWTRQDHALALPADKGSPAKEK